MGSQIISEIIWDQPHIYLSDHNLINYQIIREVAQTCMHMTRMDRVCHSDHFGTLFIIFGAPMNKSELN